MIQTKAHCFLLILVIASANIGAQEYNSVPLDHPAYEIIEMGIMRGIIPQSSSAKPWSESAVREKLWEIMDDPEQVLSTRELDTVSAILDLFDRKTGFDPGGGRYRAEYGDASIEAGIGWESVFSVDAPSGSAASVNTAKLYAAGDVLDLFSWNVTALGEFLYIRRDDIVSPFFPYTHSKSWDGGVLSLRDTGAYSPWPGNASLAGGFFAEASGAFLDDQLQLRIGRLRRDWGPQVSGASLYMNAQARPFAALEGTYSPLAWLDISLMNGALEYYRGDSQWPDDGPFVNMISMAQVELNPARLLHFSLGGSAVWLNQVNAAFFANLELRLPGIVKIWGSLFVNQLDSLVDNFTYLNGNNYAYQAGLKVLVHWLPFASFTLRYTKVEPYCYTSSYNGHEGAPVPSPSAFASGGESLGYYMPPNSDELLLRFESRLFPEIKGHVQFQMMRHGADFGYGAVPGSSLADKLTGSSHPNKYFLKDGVYRWDNVLKVGGSCTFRTGAVPLSVFAEMGFVGTSFTINGTAGIGSEGEYERLNDDVYKARNAFIFSVGFRVFP
ncbi:MAG: hypothetical protein FWG46_01015 [Treponema sp.]|nr:hypothetical protein [Treponema sp.]